MKLAEKPSLGSLPEVKALFTRGLEWLLSSSGAERAAILYGDDEKSDPKVRAAHGVGSENFWDNAPLSVTLLREVRQSGQPIYLRDVPKDPRYGDQLSLLLAGTGSLICIPFWGPTGVLAGLLYADTSGSPLTREHLQQALRLVRWLEEQLRAIVAGQPVTEITAAPTEAARPVARPVPVKEPEYATRSQVRLRPLSARQQGQFFRSLATMLAAGLPLSRGLAALGRGAADPPVAAACEELGRRLQRGQALSAALGALEIFPTLAVRLVGVGERAGALDRVLAEVADYLERSTATRMRLKSALLYPLFVLAVSLVLLVAGPGYLLTGQFKLLTSLGGQLPALTVALARVSRVVGSPLFFLPAGLTVAWLLRREGRRVPALLVKLPVFRRLARAWGAAQFARCLAVQLRAGLPLAASLEEAGAVLEHPELRRRLPEAVERLRQGDDVRTCLAGLDFFPRSFLEMVSVGEQVGRLDSMLEWLARLNEEQVEYELEALLSLLEPMVMMLLGTLAALVMLATMLPTVRLLETL